MHHLCFFAEPDETSVPSGPALLGQSNSQKTSGLREEVGHYRKTVARHYSKTAVSTVITARPL